MEAQFKINTRKYFISDLHVLSIPQNDLTLQIVSAQ